MRSHTAFQVLLLTILLNQCSPAHNPKQRAQETLHARVIYGPDHRRDILSLADPADRDLAESVAVVIPNKLLLDLGNGQTRVSGQKLGTTYSLCPSERFRDQIAPGACTAFLVSADLVVSAGHCFQTQKDCTDMRIVFGFSATPQALTPSLLKTSDIYSCHSIVHSEIRPDGVDFAVVRLNRASSRTPLTLSAGAPSPVGTPVLTVASTSGLPMKWIDGAAIREVRGNYSLANLDTAAGSSGAPIFNAGTHQVEGLLIRGDYDYEWDGSCQKSQSCRNSECTGEAFTHISFVFPYLLR